jgi:hypothetical protein
VRTNYAEIRDYFLYFLQYEPTITYNTRQIETGCNFAVDVGTYSWTLKPRNSASTEQYTIPARYRMTLEKTGTNWQISELIEELNDVDVARINALFALPELQPMRAAGNAAPSPAVAGFIKRADDGSTERPTAAAISKPEKTLRNKPRPDDDELTFEDFFSWLRWFENSR